MAFSRKILQRDRYKEAGKLKKSFLKKAIKVKRDPFSTMGYRVTDLRQKVLEYQQLLAVAIRSEKQTEVASITRKILRSEQVRLYAVYRTISSTGSRTKGTNDKSRPIKTQQYLELASQLWSVVKKPNEYKSTPLKRVYIPKPNKPEDRPLSVPSYLDRAVQHLYNFVLSVFHEEVAESRSFGFRNFRSPGMAAKAITLQIWNRKGYGFPRYAIELDIRKCFDSISHKFILENVANVYVKSALYEVIPQNIMLQWLKSGYIDYEGKYSPKNQVIPTEVGVPQGGPISPTISNLVLNGIEKTAWIAADGLNYIKSEQALSPATQIVWTKGGVEKLCTFGCTNNQELYDLLKETGLITEDFPAKYLRTKARLKSIGLQMEYKKFVDTSLNTEEKREANNQRWSSLTRFADDCVILVNSKEKAEKVIQGIIKFLEPRGLEIHPEKTVTRDLYNNEGFRFCGFEFRYETGHGETSVYNFPPADKVKVLKDKIEEIFKKRKRNPYLCFYEINAILRGWLNFYSSGNSKQIFSDIRAWLWHKTYWYLWNYHTCDFKNGSQRIRKIQLGAFLYRTYLRKPKASKGRWWMIPYENLPEEKKKRWSKSRNSYFLVNPSDVRVATPSIAVGLSAFHPDDRPQLISKANGWKQGFHREILSKNDSKCQSCQIDLLSDDVKMEIHHLTPIKFGGLNIKENCICLCYECHKEVTSAVRKKDLQRIIDLESFGILSGVSSRLSPRSN
jgi:retron-type reverse transcriptase